MKGSIKFLVGLLSMVAFVLFAAPIVAMGLEVDVASAAVGITALTLLTGFTNVQGVFFTGPDVSGITTNQFLVIANQIIRKAVNRWIIGDEASKYINVKAPLALPKLSASGNPRPYAEADNFTDGVAVTDRILTVYQSKWDYKLNPENLRNKYLSQIASGNIDALATTFMQFAAEQVAKEYLSQVLLNTVYLGVYNSAGTTAAAIATGWGTLIADLITATTITPIATGAITSTNAVEKVETILEGVPSWMKELEEGFPIICSYTTFEKYKKDYRTRYGYQFNPNAQGKFMLDNSKTELVPRAYMGTSSRLIATERGNLAYGTDGDSVAAFVTPHLDIYQVRMKMPFGFQIADLERIYVNDVA